MYATEEFKQMTFNEKPTLRRISITSYHPPIKLDSEYQEKDKETHDSCESSKSGL